jgi:hypothetical protein
MASWFQSIGFLPQPLQRAENIAQRAYRVRLIPERYTQDDVKEMIEGLLSAPETPCTVTLRSFVPHVDRSYRRTTTATFSLTGHTLPQGLRGSGDEWIFETFDNVGQQAGERLIVDSHFHGFTVLHCPDDADHDFE